MIDDQTRLQLAEDVSYQSTGEDGETVLLSLSSGSLFTCNRTTTDFLDAIDGRRTFAEIVAKLHAAYDAPPARLRADLAALAGRLLEAELVVKN